MANSYSHLLSSVAAVKAKEVDPNESERLDSDKPPANDKEDGKKAKKAKADKSEEEDDREGEEHEEKEDKNEDDEEEKEDKEDKKSKRAKKASADAGAARLEERARCAAIFQSKAAAGRADLAARFAFHTDLSAETAVMLMEGFVAEAPVSGRRVSLDQRMAVAQSANVGSDVIEQPKVEAKGVSEEELKKMDSSQKALLIVNAARSLNGEAPLLKLN